MKGMKYNAWNAKRHSSSGPSWVGLRWNWSGSPVLHLPISSMWAAALRGSGAVFRRFSIRWWSRSPQKGRCDSRSPGFIFVYNRQGVLDLKANTIECQFMGQTLLICRFKQSGPQMTMHLDHAANNSVRKLRELPEIFLHVLHVYKLLTKYS